MVRRRGAERAIFFPWERRGNLWRRLGASRRAPLFVAIGAVVVLLLLAARERRLGGVRSTRATLVTVRAAVDAFRAENEGRCPPSLTEVVSAGYLRKLPDDAWGRPLRLICPGRTNDGSFDLVSDGPDGEVGGLDRVE